MGLSTPAAARLVAAGALLIFLAHPLPHAHAQVPGEAYEGSLDLIITCSESFLEPGYMGVDEVDCELRDLSRDSVYLPDAGSGTSVSSHTIMPTFEPLNADGWQTETDLPPRALYGGDVIPFKVRAKTTPLIRTQDYRFELVVDVTGPPGYNKTIRVPFVAEVQPYDIAQVSFAQNTQVQVAGQDEVVVFTVSVQNLGVYPDSYSFVVTPSHSDLRVSTPPNLYVPPGETRTANVSVLTPHGKLLELGRGTTFTIKVSSLTGSSVYTATGVLNIRGPYVPLYWIPLLLVGLASASVVARGSREKAQMRALERGRPRRVELTPRQAVLLAELRRSDPEAYKEKKRSLDGVYKERLEDYRAHRKERVAADRAEAKQARLEFIAAKKARKARRKEERRAAKAQRAQEKRAAKLQAKEDKKEAKLLKKKEKVLAKKRKALEKERAKAEKREQKLAAKEAKAEAAAAKKAAREARKQQKKQP